MTINNIFEDSKCSLSVDTSKKILVMTNSSDEYIKSTFLSFMEHFISFWKIVESNGDKYHILLDLSEDKTAWMPMEFYITLISSLNSISDILNRSMHSMCILINNTGLTGSIIKIILKMYSPNRPIIYTTDYNEAQSFFASNKLDL